MTSFLQFLNDPDDCAICGGNRHTCDCTPAVDSPYAPPVPAINTTGDMVMMAKTGEADMPYVRVGGLLHWVLKNDGYWVKGKHQ